MFSSSAREPVFCKRTGIANAPLFLDVPKSEILHIPSWSIKMLSAFMSRCRIPRPCRYSSPSNIWSVKKRMTSSSNWRLEDQLNVTYTRADDRPTLPCVRMMRPIEPPGTYSRKIERYSGVCSIPAGRGTNRSDGNLEASIQTEITHQGRAQCSDGRDPSTAQSRP